MRSLAREVAAREGGAVNFPIAQIAEVLAHLSDIVYEHPRMLALLVANGKRRAASSSANAKSKGKR